MEKNTDELALAEPPKQEPQGGDEKLLEGLRSVASLPGDPPPRPAAADAEGCGEVLSLAEVRRRHIERVLELCGGNRVRAAQLLGIGRTSLYRFLKRNQKTRRSRGEGSPAAMKS